jgi:transposase
VGQNSPALLRQNSIAEPRRQLMALEGRRKTAQALAMWARIILACADPQPNQDVAAVLGIHPMTVGQWRRRFQSQRLDGLHDDPRAGTPRSIDDTPIEAVVARTLESHPLGSPHWNSRAMAEACGLSASTVQRIWRAFGLKPHRQEPFKPSTDPDFVAKVRDVVGVYVAPPSHAVVLCVDEKSPIQALDRSQARFPMQPGQPERRP